MAQANSGHVVLNLVRTEADDKSQRDATKAREVTTSSGQLPLSLERADLQARLEAGSYKLRVAFEPSDWSLHPPSRGRIRGSFTMQLAIEPTQRTAGSSAREEEDCQDSVIEAHQGQASAPFHLFLPRARFSAAKAAQGAGKGSLVKLVPLRTTQRSEVRVTVRSAFASDALYTTLSRRRNSGGSTSVYQAGPSDASDDRIWSCTPGYNTCQLDAVVPAGEYSLAFYQPAASGCIHFSLRIQMHPTALKYGLACHGARVLPPDLSWQALVSTSTDSGGRSSSRAALRWSESSLMVPESDAGRLDVRDTVLVTLPAGSETDSYVLHVRHRDARPASRIDISPFTSTAVSRSRVQGGVQDDSTDASEGSQAGVLVGSDGGWDTLFSASHLSVDQESLFLYKGRGSGAPSGGATGAATALGLRVSSLLAFRHQSCPTWGLSINLQKLSHLRRAGQCPPGAVNGLRLPASNLPVNPSGYAFEELDTYAPVATWPSPDPSCAVEAPSAGSKAAQGCATSADTAFAISRPSQLEVTRGHLPYDRNGHLLLPLPLPLGPRVPHAAPALPCICIAAIAVALEGGQACKVRGLAWPLQPLPSPPAVPAARLVQVSLRFEGALASYTLALIRLEPQEGSDETTVIASGLPVFATSDQSSSTSTASPFSTLSRVSLSRQLLAGKYVVRLARKTALSSFIPRAEAAELCTPLLWRIAVSPLLGDQESSGRHSDGLQPPYLLDVDPPVRFLWEGGALFAASA